MEAPLRATHWHSGFTLLELSVVLIIISLVTAMAITSGLAVVSAARFSATQQKMKSIDTALLQYRAVNDRLPCPGDLTLAVTDPNLGLEAGAGSASTTPPGSGACTGTGMAPAANFTATGVTNATYYSAEGALPALTLGLPADMMVDGWGNRFRYAVDISLTALGAFQSKPTGCINGPITVNDGNGNARSSAAVYALISHGPDGHGAYSRNGVIVNTGSSSADQLTNCHCSSTGATTTTAYFVQLTSPATYVQKASAYDAGHVGVSSYNFDDIVTYKERWQLQTPWDMAGQCNYLYVVDGGNYRVEKFDLNGNFLDAIGAGYHGAGGTAGNSGSSNGQFNFTALNSNGISVDYFGNVWVSDPGNNRIQEFSSTGNYIRKITGLTSPGAIAIDTANNIWVVNQPASNVIISKYSNTGTALTSFGSTGSGTGQFASTDTQAQIAFDKYGYLWIADGGNSRLQKCSTTGNCTVYGTSGSSTGQFSSPTGLAFDSSSNIWVWDVTRLAPPLIKFNYGFVSQGEYSSIGSTGCMGAGTSSGAPMLYIATDSSGNVWASDTGHNRVWEVKGDGSCARQMGCPAAGSPCGASTSTGHFRSPVNIFISGGR